MSHPATIAQPSPDVGFNGDVDFLGFEVDDVDLAHAHAVERGLQIV